jgi:hypothetical protein
MHPDILFTGHFDKRADGESDFTLTVGFPSPGDGIQELTVPDMGSILDVLDGAILMARTLLQLMFETLQGDNPNITKENNGNLGAGLQRLLWDNREHLNLAVDSLRQAIREMGEIEVK